jgi:short-subunit dehydrogenase
MRYKMINVKGKWALITGASRGIGHQIAIFMAKQGCNLVLHSRNLENTKELEIKLKKFGIKIYRVQAELSNQKEIISMLNEIDSKNIPIDIVFNNAGVQIAYRKDYFKTPVEDFDMSFRINFISITTICYHFLPKMIGRGFGRIINTTSGIKNEPEQAGYSASKAALDKFTQDLGFKLNGTDVMINLVDPGWCRTDLGGPNAPNPPESSIPGMVVGAFLDDKKSGRTFRAQDFAGMNLKDAILKAEQK